MGLGALWKGVEIENLAFLPICYLPSETDHVTQDSSREGCGIKALP